MDGRNKDSDKFVLFDCRSFNPAKEDLLRHFEKEVYEPAFPNSDEREPFDEIISRIKNIDGAIISSCVLALVDGNVAGGLVTDFYPDIKALEIIYIAVSEAHRNTHLGTRLFHEGLEMVKTSLGEVKNVFLEVEIPETEESFVRASIWEHWGAKRLPFSYCQPALSVNTKPTDGLMLMALTDESVIGTKDVKDFLKAFYKGLNAYDSPMLGRMLSDLNRIDENGEISLDDFTENPSFSFPSLSVTRHYNYMEEGLWEYDKDVCPVYNSFECDLMNFRSQSKRPFNTHFFSIFRGKTVVFPSFYQYSSEGIVHYRRSLHTELLFDIAVSWTYCFVSQRHIIHLTFAPSADCQINELDAIKLISQFGSRQEEYKANSPIMIKEGNELYSLETFLCRILRPGCYQPLDTGLSQIDFSNIYNLRESEEMNFSSVDDLSMPECSLQNKCICGLLLGIFDYERMNSDEIADTAIPVLSSADSVVYICRGHMLKIEIRDEEESRFLSAILSSPYLLIPSAVLAYNGLAITNTKDKIEGLSNNRLSLLSLNYIGSIQRELTDYYMLDIFQYPSEKDIFNYGSVARGLETDRIHLLSVVDNLKESRQIVSNIVLEAFLGIVAIFQIMGVIEELIDGYLAFIIVLIVFIFVEIVRVINIVSRK